MFNQSTLSILELPPTVALEIFRYLPFKDCVCTAMVCKYFNDISAMVISEVKKLDLDDPVFEKLTPDGLSKLVSLCAKNLVAIEFSNDLQENGLPLLTSFSKFSCPNLEELDLVDIKFSDIIFGALMRNNPNLRSLTSHGGIPLKYPARVVSVNLARLDLDFCDNACFRGLKGHCPNLTTLSIRHAFLNSGKAFDQFCGSCPEIEVMYIKEFHGVRIKSLVQFWHLRSLNYFDSRISFGNDAMNDEFLIKMSQSFPQLKLLYLPFISVTSVGISALSSLQHLTKLKLGCHDSYIDTGIRKLAECGRLEALILFGGEITAETFVTLLRCCFSLGDLMISNVEGVDTEEAGVELLREAACSPGASLSICIDSWPWLYRSKLIGGVLKEIEESGGRKINRN